MIPAERDGWLTPLPATDGHIGTWQERGLCRQVDPEVFFPEMGGSTREAKRICAGCDVRDVCLEDALSRRERFGVWGGLSERERLQLLRRARLARLARQQPAVAAA